MKSKPVYGWLALDVLARRHVFVALGTEAKTVCDGLSKTVRDGETLLFCASADGDVATLARHALQDAGMETAFYLAGPEATLWQIAAHLNSAGVNKRRVQMQIVGSWARRVYCPHCTTNNEAVTTTLHNCQGCGILLYVRDHFSRPRGAYMGVCADAETPGIAPEPEVAYA